jgi:hypothetical protein
MLDTGKKNIAVDAADISGGLATAYPPHSIAKNQVSDILNALIEKRGWSRSPAYKGYRSTPVFAGPNGKLQGLFNWKIAGGEEKIIAVADYGNIHEVTISGTSLSLGSSLYDMNTGEKCHAVNSFGKLWLCCGAVSIKLEYYPAVGETPAYIEAYRVGIEPPPGTWTVEAFDYLEGNIPVLDTGTEEILDSFPKGFVLPRTATLPVGVYGIMTSYARKIGDTIVLYSAPTDYGTISIAEGQAIRITPSESSDPQVTDIAVWMTDADGSVYYFYGSAAHDSEKIEITGDSNKNIFLLMYEQAAGNQLPVDLSGWMAFDGRLFGWKSGDNNIYYSMKSQNVYDLERWSTEFYIPTVPFSILSLHSCGNDLYVNTRAGIYRIPNGDITAKPEAVTATTTANSRQLFFQFPDTVIEYNDILIGLTNDGFRYFNGERFSDDLSMDIRPIVSRLAITALGSGEPSYYQPVGLIYNRQSKRIEYQLSYIDSEVSTRTHNMRLVANISKLFVDGSIAWELNQAGFCHYVILSDNTLVLGQNYYIGGTTNEASTIVSESGVSDINCYCHDATFITEKHVKECRVRTSAFCGGLWGIDEYSRVYILATTNAAITAALYLIDRGAQEVRKTTVSGIRTVPILDSETMPFILDHSTLPDEFPRVLPIKLPMNTKANYAQLLFSQTADDGYYQIYEIYLYGQHRVTVFT